MPWLFTFGMIFLFVAIFTIIKAIRSKNPEYSDDGPPVKTISIVAASISGVLAALCLLWSVTYIVSTRNVGIETQFGRPVGTLSNGIHFKSPLNEVSELDGTIRTDTRTDGWEGDGDGRCLSTAIRLANNSTACVDNTIGWRIVPEKADSLFRDYRSKNDDVDGNIRDNLVTRELDAVLNQLFSGYNPLSPEAQAAGGPNLAEYGEKATNMLRERIGDRIEVQKVIIPLVHFDRTTQEKINLTQAEIANTRIAQQKEQTAAAESRANSALSASVNNDPNVLVSKCLDIVKALNQSPLGCWPGVNAVPTVPAR